MDVLSSTPVTLWVDFEAPQGLVIPDVGKTFYSLYDGAGVPLAVQQVLTPAAEATGVSIPILAIHNVLDEGHAFERRQVVVTFEASGRSFSRRQAYRVITLPGYSSTPADVRTYLAINEDELRDDEVDLFAAHLALATQVGPDVLEAALSSGTYAELRAERAIVLTAATALFPSLRYRIAQAKTDGTLKFERLKDASAFDGLVEATNLELLDTVSELTGITADVTVVPTLIRLTTIGTDPVTGSAPAVGA